MNCLLINLYLFEKRLIICLTVLPMSDIMWRKDGSVFHQSRLMLIRQDFKNAADPFPFLASENIQANSYQRNEIKFVQITGKNGNFFL